MPQRSASWHLQIVIFESGFWVRPWPWPWQLFLSRRLGSGALMFLPHCRPALYHLRDYCYPCGSKISLEMRTTKPETDIRCRLIGMKQGERTQKIAKYVWASHARKERVITNVTDSRECHSGIVFTICTNQFHLPKNGREGLKLVSNMAWRNGTRISVGIFNPENQGYLFRCTVCSWKFSAGTTKKVMFCLLSNPIFRNLFVNGKQPSFRGETSDSVFKRSAV